MGREPARVSVVHVTDLVEGLLAAARGPHGAARKYFIANSAPVSWEEFAGVIGDLLGRRLRTVCVPPWLAWTVGLLAEAGSRFSSKPSIISRDKVREARCRYWVCDTTRARRELGFTATMTLRQGAAQTLEWYQREGWLRP
jgi:nucleoside-diphosphate-sugar epimerase